MKKIIAFVTVCFVAACMSSCAGIAQKSHGQSSSEAESSSEKNGVEVDKGLFDVTITIPETLAGEDAASELTDEQRNMGFKSMTRNGDGSITYVITKKAHESMIDDLRVSTTEALDGIVTSGKFPSIKKIEYSNDFTKVSMRVNKEAFEDGFDSLSTFSVWFSGALYQAFNGADVDKLSVTINVVDDATNETFKTIKYPEALED